MQRLCWARWDEPRNHARTRGRDRLSGADFPRSALRRCVLRQASRRPACIAGPSVRHARRDMKTAASSRPMKRPRRLPSAPVCAAGQSWLPATRRWMTPIASRTFSPIASRKIWSAMVPAWKASPRNSNSVRGSCGASCKRNSVSRRSSCCRHGACCSPSSCSRKRGCPSLKSPSPADSRVCGASTTHSVPHYRMPPTGLRRRAAAHAPIALSDTLTLQLLYRPPYDWAGLLRFPAGAGRQGRGMDHR